MKKYLALIMVFVLILTASTASFTAFANDDVVRIEFCVGDDTLSINGEQIKVEKPYVVGEGVTLVPLRVITEAFGATVEWTESTQSIDLTYPDVNIHLQIGNPVAEVNSKAETLLAAPELPDSTTMVPLRFISETFGATVSYDEATEKITVVKDNATNGSGTVEGTVTNKYIGDSFYGWSIENPVDMQMDERYFDGLFTAFTYDEYNGFFVGIRVLEDDYDFERDFINEKAALQNYTLVKADKNADAPNGKTMHFQAKDKKTFIDAQIIITDKYKYLVFGSFDANNTELRDEYVKLLSTFETNYRADDIYDLSNAENGVRRFSADHLKFSMDIPENFYMSSDEDAQNDYVFYSLNKDDTESRISIHVTSKDAETNAKTLAERDFRHNKETLNEDIMEFHGAVRETQYDNFKVYEYTYDTNKSAASSTHRDVFFEIGDYIYNVHLAMQLPFDTYRSFMDSIINSIKAEKLDPEEVGVLLRYDVESTGTFSSTVANCTLKLPNTYSEQVSDTVAEYESSEALVAVNLGITPANGISHKLIKENMENLERSYRVMPDTKIVTSTTDSYFGDTKYAHLCISKESDGSKVYIAQYALAKRNVLYLFTVTYGELSYSSHYREEVKKIIKSLEIK